MFRVPLWHLLGNWLLASSRTGRIKGTSLAGIEMAPARVVVMTLYRLSATSTTGVFKEMAFIPFGEKIRIRKKTTITGHLLHAQHCVRGFCSSCRLGMKQLNCQIQSFCSQREYLMFLPAQEACPRVKNSCTTGELFCRLNPV